jgi:orotidine-5'-phosphate decarboxylase
MGAESTLRPATAAFADRLTERVRALGHPLCVGLDPYPELVPRRFKAPSEAQTMRGFLRAIVDLAISRVAIVKPQMALFERLGIAGLEVLAELVAHARANGLLVLLDAKRGDIGATARGYAEAYLGARPFIEADAVTVNPYMGLDAIEPFIDLAEANGKGVFVLVRNSNPGADAFQTLPVHGRPLFETVAASLRGFEQRLQTASGWSSLGVTVSARAPADALTVRQLLPTALQLVLGYGHQGGTASDATAALARRATGFEGGLVNSSRAVLYPRCEDGNWEQAIIGAIDQAAAGLRHC